MPWRRSSGVKERGAAADAALVKKWIALLFPFVLALGARAQERIATIVLDDGSQLMGRVVAMDVGSLQLDVRGRIVTVTSARIRSCRIEDAPAEDPATDPAQPQHPSPAPGGETRSEE